MRKNIKTIIGLLIAFIIGISTTVGATTIFNSKDITYSSDKTEATNVKDSLDELYDKASKMGECPEGTTCLKPISTVEVGDYIFYSPTANDYTVSKSLTGTTTDQIIKPSHFYLWLVIQKNEDGSVEAISVSGKISGNTWLNFKGTTGYKNFVSVLYNIAINITGYDSEIFDSDGTRPFGYKDQLWTCTAVNTATACPTDSSYYEDYNLFYQIAMNNDNDDDWYESWLTSREWKDAKNLNLRYMNNNGIESSDGVLVNNVAKEVSSRVRVIVKFNKDLLVEAREGTRDKPLHVLNPTYYR